MRVDILTKKGEQVSGTTVSTCYDPTRIRTMKKQELLSSLFFAGIVLERIVHARVLTVFRVETENINVIS